MSDKRNADLIAANASTTIVVSMLQRVLRRARY